jgi:hypothetical protein
MYDEHWSDDAIIEKLLLGSSQGDERHLSVCPVCAQKWQEAQATRTRLMEAEPYVPPSLLAKQRRAIRDRMRPTPIRRKLVPAIAAAALAVIVMMVLFKPAAQQPPIQDSAADTAVFEDVFKISSSTEPDSVGPVKSLFEVQQ